MSEIKQVLRHHMDGVKKRRIARLLGLNRNTVGKYIERAEADTLSLEELLRLDAPVLERRLSSGKRALPDPRFESLSKRLDYITGELEGHKNHLTMYRLWQEYCSEEKEHYELLLSAKTFSQEKNRLKPSLGFQPFLLPLFLPQNPDNMNKGTHFIGQPTQAGSSMA